MSMLKLLKSTSLAKLKHPQTILSKPPTQHPKDPTPFYIFVLHLFLPQDLITVILETLLHSSPPSIYPISFRFKDSYILTSRVNIKHCQAKVDRSSCTGPTGITIGKNGKTFVASSFNNFISVFSKEGVFETSFGHGTLMNPQGLSIDKNFNILVCDYLHCKIRKFNPQYKLISSFHESYPIGVAVTSDGLILVSSFSEHIVSLFSKHGERIMTFPGLGLSNPRGLCVDNKDHVYVCDSGNKRVLIFDLKGKILKKFEPKIRFASPLGVAVDREGNFVVSDCGNQRVVIYSPNGEEVSVLNDDDDVILNPHGITVDYEGNVVVADYSGQCFCIFG